jgi:hypothetical protein
VSWSGRREAHPGQKCNELIIQLTFEWRRGVRTWRYLARLLESEEYQRLSQHV